jgi:hypothetical protein
MHGIHSAANLVKAENSAQAVFPQNGKYSFLKYGYTAPTILDGRISALGSPR